MEKNKILILVNKILLNYCVESFGIFNQSLTIEFVSNNLPKTTLSIETHVIITPSDNIKKLNPMEQNLVNIAKINLSFVTNIEIDNHNNLIIQFSNNYVLTISGLTQDGYPEVWSLNHQIDDKHFINIIALSEEGFAVWDYQ